MKTVFRALFLLIASVASTSATFAQTLPFPAPRYLKGAVFIRVWYDQAFLNYWQSRDINSQVEGWFNEMRAQYKNNPKLQDVDIFLLKDNSPLDPAQNPFIGPNAYFDPLHNVVDDPAMNQVGGQRRLLNRMRDAFSTSAASKLHRGRTYTLGRIINVLFVHQVYGQDAGAVYEIGNLNSTRANLFITTLAGPSRRTPTAPQPTGVGTEMPRDYIIQNLGHEIGHLLGGKHELSDNCPAPTARPFVGGELMCSSNQRTWEFGPRNSLAVTNVIKPALGRCNSAFVSRASCERFVDQNLCLSGTPADQIAFCQADAKVNLCSDICSNDAKTAVSIIRNLPSTVINGPL